MCRDLDIPWWEVSPLACIAFSCWHPGEPATVLNLNPDHWLTTYLCLFRLSGGSLLHLLPQHRHLRTCSIHGCLQLSSSKHHINLMNSGHFIPGLGAKDTHGPAHPRPQGTALRGGYCYDSIRLGLGPIPEPHPTPVQPPAFQPRCVACYAVSCDLVLLHISAYLHVLTCIYTAPEGVMVHPLVLHAF